jgi:hypothetical protein
VVWKSGPVVSGERCGGDECCQKQVLELHGPRVLGIVGWNVAGDWKIFKAGRYSRPISKSRKLN